MVTSRRSSAALALHRQWRARQVRLRAIEGMDASKVRPVARTRAPTTAIVCRFHSRASYTSRLARRADDERVTRYDFPPWINFMTRPLTIAAGLLLAPLFFAAHAQQPAAQATAAKPAAASTTAAAPASTVAAAPAAPAEPKAIDLKGDAAK